MPRRSIVWVLALPILAGGASCRTTAADCRFESSERCLWEAGVAPPKAGDGSPEPDGVGDEVDELGTGETTELDETLNRMILIIGAGLEWGLVDERARTLCRGPEGSSPDDPDEAGEAGSELPVPSEGEGAWACRVGELELNGRPLALEASEGVLSLSAADIGDAESAELFELAQRRFDGWCAGEPLRQVQGGGLQEFYRCSLPEGPYLVVARFPRDLESGRWQVSIAIVDAG